LASLVIAEWLIAPIIAFSRKYSIPPTFAKLRQKRIGVGYPFAVRYNFPDAELEHVSAIEVAILRAVAAFLRESAQTRHDTQQ
jgi:hypothetical protein